MRIHGIPEGSEKNNMIGFVTDFIHSSLQIPDDMDIRIERAQHSLIAKPKESDAPPRAIIVPLLGRTYERTGYTASMETKDYI